MRKYWTLRKRQDPLVDKWSETDHVQELRCPWCDQLFEEVKQVKSHSGNCKLKPPYRQNRTATIRAGRVLLQAEAQQASLPGRIDAYPLQVIRA